MCNCFFYDVCFLRFWVELQRGETSRPMQPRGLQLIRIRPSNEIKQIASDAPPYFLTTFLLFSMTMPLVPLVAGWPLSNMI